MGSRRQADRGKKNDQSRTVPRSPMFFSSATLSGVVRRISVNINTHPHTAHHGQSVVSYS